MKKGKHSEKLELGGVGGLKHDCYIYCSFYRCSHVWVKLIDFLKIKKSVHVTK